MRSVGLTFATVLLIQIFGPLTAQVLRWRKLVYKEPAPSQRRDCAIGYDSKNGSIILFGGRSASTALSDTWILNVSNTSWKQVANSKNTPPGIYGGIYGGSENGFTLAFGRGAAKNAIYNDVYNFDFNTSKWKLVAVSGQKPKSRYFSGGGIIGGNFYVSHGRGESQLISDTYKFDVANPKWEKLHDDVNQYHPLLPHSRYGQSVVTLPGNKLLMFGGCLSGEKSAGPCASSDSWLFDETAKKWTRLRSCSTPRLYSVLALLPNSTEQSSVAILYGGEESSKQTIKVNNRALVDEVVVYDTMSGNWERKVTQKDPVYGFPEIRYGHCMTTTTTGIAIFGGVATSSGKLLKDIWLLEGDTTASRNSPTRDECGSHVGFITVHGILMFLSWGILLQISGFVARYLKHRRQIWFNLHRILAATGLVIAVIGFSLGVVSVRGGHFSFAHGAIGLDIMLAGLYQPLNATFRPAAPEEGEKPKLWRKIWEISHRFTGRIALLLALINISLGLFLSLAQKAIWITWFGYLFVIIMAYAVAEYYSRKMARSEKNSIQVAHSLAEKQ